MYIYVITKQNSPQTQWGIVLETETLQVNFIPKRQFPIVGALGETPTWSKETQYET